MAKMTITIEAISDVFFMNTKAKVNITDISKNPDGTFEFTLEGPDVDGLDKVKMIRHKKIVRGPLFTGELYDTFQEVK